MPILTSYQIEWNKLRDRLLGASIQDVTDDGQLAGALGDEAAVVRLRGALGPRSNDILRDILDHECDLYLRLLDGSFREYQRSAQRWYQAISPAIPAGRATPILRAMLSTMSTSSRRWCAAGGRPLHSTTPR